MVIKEITAPGDQALIVRFDGREEIVEPWVTMSFCVEDPASWSAQAVSPAEVQAPVEPVARYPLPDQSEGD